MNWIHNLTMKDETDKRFLQNIKYIRSDFLMTC